MDRIDHFAAAILSGNISKGVKHNKKDMADTYKMAKKFAEARCDAIGHTLSYGKSVMAEEFEYCIYCDYKKYL